MFQQRGYSLIELLVSLGMIAVMSAVAVPLVLESNRLTELRSGSEAMGALIRQTRLRAISQAATYRVRFDCPGANQTRALILTGNALVDNAANRCTVTLNGDTGILAMPTGVAADPANATELRVTPRGVFTAIGDAIPLTITMTYGTATRTLTVSATGQITYSE